MGTSGRKNNHKATEHKEKTQKCEKPLQTFRHFDISTFDINTFLQNTDR